MISSNQATPIQQNIPSFIDTQKTSQLTDPSIPDLQQTAKQQEQATSFV